jgi:hypothetical protein
MTLERTDVRDFGSGMRRAIAGGVPPHETSQSLEFLCDMGIRLSSCVPIALIVTMH